MGQVLWLTGLPGSGKSTIAAGLEGDLKRTGHPVYVLDGDRVRRGLNEDLGFSPADRTENVRRLAHVAALMADAGLVAIVAAISPYRADRASARAIAVRQGVPFREIFVSADAATCEARDPKGHYGRARRGEMTAFTGVDAPYEPPLEPDLVVDTSRLDVPAAVAFVLRFVTER